MRLSAEYVVVVNLMRQFLLSLLCLNWDDFRDGDDSGFVSSETGSKPE
jgi:hypothetical protein